jgi:hypothetical protein
LDLEEKFEQVPIGRLVGERPNRRPFPGASSTHHVRTSCSPRDRYRRLAALGAPQSLAGGVLAEKDSACLEIVTFAQALADHGKTGKVIFPKSDYLFELGGAESQPST